MLRLKASSGIFTRHIPALADMGTAGLPILRCFAAAPSNQMALIKQLREQTGAPIADVKSALQQAEWDLGTLKLWV